MITGFPPAIHGQAKASEDIYNYFVKQGYIVTVLPLPDVESNSFTAKLPFFLKIYVNLFLHVSFKQRPLLYISPGRRLAGFMRDFPILLWSKFFAEKTIIQLHGGEFFSNKKDIKKFVRPIFRFAYRHIDHFIILSKNIIPEIGFREIFENKIIVIPYGIQERGVVTEKKFDVIHILYLSNLIPSKGYLEVLKLADYLVNIKGIRNIEFHFCGNFIQTPNEKNLSLDDFEVFVQDFDLKSFVKYHGAVSGTVKEQMLEKAHFFVLPTNYPAEAQPISILEAMSFGTIVISTNYRAIPEMVIDGITGFLIEKNNINLMAEKIQSLIENPQLYKVMQKKSFEHLTNNFSQDISLRKIHDLFI